MILSGRDLKWYIETGKLKIEGVELSQFQQNGIDIVLGSAERTQLDKGGFCLATTREYFEMPDDLVALVGLRSTWARKGLSNLGPTWVDAGFHGEITLEIASWVKQTLPIGEPFAHLVFMRTTTPAEPYRGKYQGQRGITASLPDPPKGDV